MPRAKGSHSCPSDSKRAANAVEGVRGPAPSERADWIFVRRASHNASHHRDQRTGDGTSAPGIGDAVRTGIEVWYRRDI